MNTDQLRTLLIHIYKSGRQEAEATINQVLAEFEAMRSTGKAAAESWRKVAEGLKGEVDIANLRRDEALIVLRDIDRNAREALGWDAPSSGNNAGGAPESVVALIKQRDDYRDNPKHIVETDDRRTVRQTVRLMQGLPITEPLTDTAEGVRQCFEAYHQIKAINQDHCRTIQQLRARNTEHTRREELLAQKVQAVVDEASKLSAEFTERGRTIERLQTRVERYRKRGNMLAEQSRRNKDDYTGACATIVKMYEAATGTKGQGPKAGVVEDMAAVRAEGDLAVSTLEKVVQSIKNRQAIIGRTDAPPYTLLRDVLKDIASIIDTGEPHYTVKKPVDPLADSCSAPSGWSTDVQWSPPPSPKKCKATTRSDFGNVFGCINDEGHADEHMTSTGYRWPAGARFTQEQIDYIASMIKRYVSEAKWDLSEEEWGRIRKMIHEAVSPADAAVRR